MAFFLSSEDQSDRPNKRRRNELTENDNGHDNESDEASQPMLDENQNWFIYNGQHRQEIPDDITHVTADPSIQEIMAPVFSFRPALLKIVISVKTIDECAFCYCDSLVDVKLCKGLEIIFRAAFSDCRSLVTVELPLGLTIIGEEVFAGCESLRTISVPSTVETIGESAFVECISLTEVHLHHGLKTIGVRAFCLCTALSNIQLPDGLQTLETSAFEMCTALSTATVPTSLSVISTNAFVYCANLVDVHLQEGLRRIDSGAFHQCTSLTSIALPSTLELVGSRAFMECTSLLSVEFPIGGTCDIADEAFADCSALVNLSIPDRVESVADDAFDSCPLLMVSTDRLRNRFGRLPIHEACYHSSVLTKEKLVATLGSVKTQDVEKDIYGMTPLHIIATSANPKVDIWECLLDEYAVEVLECKDLHGKTMLDYLLQHTSKKVVPLLQMVLEKAIVDPMSKWDLESRCESELANRVQRALGSDNAETRRKHVQEALLYAENCKGLEVSSILELVSWKRRMKKVKLEDPEAEIDRVACRCQCGAEIVMESVLEFLWNDESRCTLLSDDLDSDSDSD
mmetsp:Transcript_16971/g.41362  ORF Transcript_16971/g.41362 Transcript_16971/m.41362 type:complete len:571 (-) Transcript_16971:517-2229(-)